MSSQAQARAIVEALRLARRSVSAQALILGDLLLRARDERLHLAYNHSTLRNFLAAELPELELREARQLVELAQKFGDADRVTLMRAGPTKLALIASLPDEEDRTALLAAAAEAPYSELRNQIEEIKTRRNSEAARAIAGARAQLRADGSPDADLGAEVNKPKFIDALRRPAGSIEPTFNDTERRERAERVLTEARTALAERGVRQWEIGTLLLQVREERLWQALDLHSFDAFLTQEDVDLSRAEAARLMRVVETMTGVEPRLRARLGFDKLALMASVQSPTARQSLVDAALDGDSLQQLRERVKVIDRAAGAETNRTIAARVAAEQHTPAPAEVYIDQRDQLSPFNVIFLSGETEPVFRGATDPQLVEQMLLRYTRAGDRIIDLTAGIGTVADEARRMHRRCVSYDIIDPPLRPDIKLRDARQLREAEDRNDAELIFFDPPIPDGFDYGKTYGNASTGRDLSLFDYPAYVEACGRIFTAAREVLHPGGTLVICAREFRHFDGHFFDTPAHLSGAARKAGLAFRDKFIAVLAPGRRAGLLRSEGFRAGRANISLIASTTVLVFGRPTNDMEES